MKYESGDTVFVPYGTVIGQPWYEEGVVAESWKEPTGMFYRVVLVGVNATIEEIHHDDLLSYRPALK